MRKGLYSSAIGLIAVLIITGISYSGIGSLQAGNESSARELSDFKLQAQNTEYLLGKAIADAISDSAYAGGDCMYASESAELKVQGYVSQTMAETYGEICTASISSFDGAKPAQIDIEVQVDCAKDIRTGQSFEYEKLMAYGKAVTVNPVVGVGCNIIVTDLYSGLEEVNLTS